MSGFADRYTHPAHVTVRVATIRSTDHNHEYETGHHRHVAIAVALVRALALALAYYRLEGKLLPM